MNFTPKSSEILFGEDINNLTEIYRKDEIVLVCGKCAKKIIWEQNSQDY